jgi:hypothetical protein
MLVAKRAVVVNAEALIIGFATVLRGRRTKVVTMVAMVAMVATNVVVTVVVIVVVTVVVTVVVVMAKHHGVQLHPSLVSQQPRK